MPTPAAGEDRDLWWRIDDDASTQAGRALQAYGLPWLDGFPDRDAVLAAFESTGPTATGLSPAGALDIADVYRATGRKADQRRTLERYVAHPVLPLHADYLADYLRRHGHEDLVPMITTSLGVT